MSDVTVTLDHRAAAVAHHWYGHEADVPKYALQWRAGDRFTIVVGSVTERMVADLNRTARLIATSQHRVRAAVIAGLRGLLESAHTVDGSPVYNAEYVYADSVRNLIETLEAANG
jgi:hypothetical protein